MKGFFAAAHELRMLVSTRRAYPTLTELGNHGLMILAELGAETRGPTRRPVIQRDGCWLLLLLRSLNVWGFRHGHLMFWNWAAASPVRWPIRHRL